MFLQFSDGKFTMKLFMKILISVLLFFFFYLFSPVAAFGATCDSVVGNLTASPESGTTNTVFTISGTINDCANESNVLDQPGGLRLFGDSGEDTDNPFVAGLTTDENGRFSAEIVAPTEGTWTAQVYYLGSPIGGSNSITIRVSQGQTYACGDDVPPNSTACPQECPSSQVPGSQLWKCGGPPTPTPEVINSASPTIRPPEPPCKNGTKELIVGDPNNPSDDYVSLKECHSVMTGLGIELNTDPYGLIGSLFTFFLSISGGILLAIIIYSGYQMMTSQGEPEKIKIARERITSAIIGFIFLIFSMVILEVIGVNILRIPGFCGQNDPECQQANFAEPTPIPTRTPTDTPLGRPR